MSAPRVEWDGDCSTCGRFVIQGETVRGEPRFYYLMGRDETTIAAMRELNIDGSTDKRAVRRQAQRVADALA